MGKEWLSQGKVIILWTGNIPTSLQYCSSNKSVSADTASFQGEREMGGRRKTTSTWKEKEAVDTTIYVENVLRIYHKPTRTKK